VVEPTEDLPLLIPEIEYEQPLINVVEPTEDLPLLIPEIEYEQPLINPVEPIEDLPLLIPEIEYGQPLINPVEPGGIEMMPITNEGVANIFDPRYDDIFTDPGDIITDLPVVQGVPVTEPNMPIIPGQPANSKPNDLMSILKNIPPLAWAGIGFAIVLLISD
ncbi:MAG: hypothetical protein AB1432_11655, partial [Bacteroidota bacterium]